MASNARRVKRAIKLGKTPKKITQNLFKTSKMAHVPKELKPYNIIYQ